MSDGSKQLPTRQEHVWEALNEYDAGLTTPEVWRLLGDRHGKYNRSHVHDALIALAGKGRVDLVGGRWKAVR